MGENVILSFCLSVAVAGVASATETLPAAKLARQQAGVGEWQHAIDNYNKALVASPNNSVCLAERGYAYAVLGNCTQAFADFAAAIKSDADCHNAYSSRSRLYAWLGLTQLAKKDANTCLAIVSDPAKDPDSQLEHARWLYSAGRKKEADQECKQALAFCSQGKGVTSLLLAARANYNLGRFQDSVYCFTQSLKVAPDSLYLHLQRGEVYCDLKQWRLAIADCDLCLRHKKNPWAFAVRGLCHERLGEFAKAIKDYDQAIKLVPDFPFCLNQRGLAYADSSCYEKALADFSAAINLESTDAYFYVNRAWALEHQHKWASALKDAQQAVSLAPRYSEAYAYRARAYYELGNISEAMEDYHQAIVFAPKSASLYYERGMSYREHKQYAKAIADLTEAIRYDPSDAIKFCARGSAFVSNQQYKQAIDDCSQSLKLNPKRVHPHFSRGIAYAKLGNTKLALQDLDEAIRMSPDYGEAYFERSQVYKSIGDKISYSLDLQKAKSLGYQSPEAMR